MNKRVTRKQILAGLPDSASNRGWVVLGSEISEDHQYGVTLPIGHKRYFFTYNEEHHCFVRLREVNRVEDSILAKAHNLGITKEDVGSIAELKRVEITDLEDQITDLWELKSGIEGYFPYNMYENKAVGIFKDKHGDWSYVADRHGYKREGLAIDTSLALLNRWLYKDHPTHIDGKIVGNSYKIWADVLYAKMRYLITGKLPEFNRLTQIDNKEQLTREEYFQYLFDFATRDNLMLFLLGKLEGNFSTSSGRDRLEEYLSSKY